MPSVMESIPKSTMINQQIREFIREMIMTEKVKELHVQMNEAQWRKSVSFCEQMNEVIC